MIGKLPLDLLKKYIFNRTGVQDNSVIIGPSYGEDAAIIDLGNDKVLVVHVDPITGAIEWLGWLAVHIACNDIAVRGVKPRWLLPVLYLPEDTTENLIDRITIQIDTAAKEVKVTIVGGHSEFTPDLSRPLISMTAIGVTRKGEYVITSGAKPGDYIIMTKSVAIEGTAILATDFREILKKKGVPDTLINRGASFLKRISVVPEALTLAEIGVNAMHDPTEGGLLGGLAEMAYASNVQIEVWEDKVPIAEETKVFCKELDIDPLKLISSGVLIASISEEKLKIALDKVKALGIPISVIGMAKKGLGLLVHRSNGSIEHIGRSVSDELYTLWEKYEKE